MEEKQTKRKPKRILKDISFENDSAHLALVHRDQGGPASGADYKLVVKSMDKYSEEFLERASQVSVTLEITEYLTRFYGLMQADAEILARSLGYTTAGQEKYALEQQEEMLEDQEPPEYPSWEDEPGDKKFERYVESKVASIDVMKQLYEAEDITEVLSNLPEDKYLQLLVDQSKIEKAFKKIDTEKNKPAKAKVKTKFIEQDNPTDSVEKSTEAVTSKIVHEVINEDKPSVVTKHKEKKSMAKETVQVIDAEIEVVNKSQFDEIQKQFNDQQIELQKALDLVKQFQAEKLEAIAKSRNAAIKDALKDDAKAEVIAKSLRSDLDDTEFQAVVKALADITVQLEKSALFQEQGASVEVEANAGEDALARLIKSKYNK